MFFFCPSDYNIPTHCCLVPQVLGQKKKQNLGGYSAVAIMPHTGHIFYAPVVQGAPTALRMKIADVVANK